MEETDREKTVSGAEWRLGEVAGDKTALGCSLIRQKKSKYILNKKN